MKKRLLVTAAALALLGLAACENPYIITIGPAANETTTTVLPSPATQAVPAASVLPTEQGS